MLLIILYDYQKLTPSQCFWDSPSKRSQRRRQVHPWLPAFKPGNCPPVSCPALSAHLHYKSSSSKVSVHRSIIMSSSMGRSASCKTQGGRGFHFSLRIPGPRRRRRPRPLCLYPTSLQLHLHLQLPARKQGQWWEAFISLCDLQEGFSWIQQNWLLPCPGNLQDPIREMGNLTALSKCPSLEDGELHHKAPTNGISCSCFRERNAIALYLWDIQL